MLSNVLSILLGAVALLALAGCDEISKRSSGGGEILVTGKVGEVMVVCETAVWESEIKNYLDTGLTQFIMPYFPDVTTFELVHRTPDKFENGVKRYRNTLFINIDPTFSGEDGLIEKRMDVWATDQLVIDITGKDFNQVLETCKKGLDYVHDEFDYMEWKRIVNRLNKEGPKHISTEVKKQFGFDMKVPLGSKIVTSRSNFYRIEFPVDERPMDFMGSDVGSDQGAILSGVMVYHYDFTDSSQLDFKRLLSARDTMLKYNVPSEVEGMYMGTQYAEIVYPEFEPSESDTKVQGYDMRGMFVFTGKDHFGTGGAFWSFHFVNPKTTKVVCVSGYVDAAPTTSWTHSLRKVQAVLKSVKLDP